MMKINQEQGSRTRTEKSSADKIDLRNEIQEAFRSHPVRWFNWVFDHLDLPDRARILEIGGGTGQLWQENRDRIPRGWQIVLTDLSIEMVRSAEGPVSEAASEAAVLALDSHRLAFPSQHFDAVVAIGVLDQVENLNQVLLEARRVLRRGGLLLTSAGGQAHLKELRALLKSFVPAGQADQLGGEEERFGLENGATRLSAYFEDIQRDDYNDVLRFTHYQPVLDYIFSEDNITNSMRVGHLAHFTGQIKRRIEQTGELRVTIQKGLFTARKADAPVKR